LIDSSGIRDRRAFKRVKRKIFYIVAKIGKVFVRSERARSIFYRAIGGHDYLEASPILRKTMSLVIEDEIIGDLESISCPTLIIWGRDDKTTPLLHAHLIKKRVKRASTSIIDGAKHSPQFTHTEKVADTVARFLK